MVLCSSLPDNQCANLCIRLKAKGSRSKMGYTNVCQSDMGIRVMFDDGKYVLSSAVGEVYVVFWELDSSKKKSAYYPMKNYPKALQPKSALDRANTEGTLFPVPSTFNVVDTDIITISSTKDDAEADEMIICLEDRLKAEGILSSDN
ncbi:Quinonprotein alcohol dehydrogenase-like-superfamily [Artemisia annua]|uniref:Quinonprotein alcohol dehydrogenase-like-superfamily n=1 Tax=Artemisia annua TaxID=35608 RepID=A0A2U1MW02_ARTAN|nr:Quinonprotein alcohol dehydrogenase-like-superfamily [Artemisia annua]